jgi:hypothetical protein
MYVPRPSRSDGGRDAGEQPRVYQVWRGNNVSSSIALSPPPCLLSIAVGAISIWMHACTVQILPYATKLGVGEIELVIIFMSG